MKRWLPFPLQSALLLAVWLVLNQSLHPAHWVLGGVIAVALPLALSRLMQRVSSLRQAATAARLFVVFLKDIVVSNLTVARLILGPERAIHPRFVWVPISIRNEQGLAVYASMITMTPGTLSVDLSQDRRWLLVHAFNISDEAALAAELHQRYEKPLMEIFT